MLFGIVNGALFWPKFSVIKSPAYQLSMVTLMMTTHQNGFRFFKFTPIFCRITPITMGKLRVLTIMLLLADYCL